MGETAEKLLKEQLEKLCEVNSVMLEKLTGKPLLDETDIKVLEVVNNSISNLGTILNRGW